MARIDLFCEDACHELFVGSLVRRVAREMNQHLALNIISSTGGIPAMKRNLENYLDDLLRELGGRPDAIIVVVDANCKGINGRRRDIASSLKRHRELVTLIQYAIPDPHIERWMLADPDAFNAVFGRGCTLPALKCARGEYKRLLRDEIKQSGFSAPLGGREFAEDIVAAMDLRSVYREQSLGNFVRDLGDIFRRLT